MKIKLDFIYKLMLAGILLTPIVLGSFELNIIMAFIFSFGFILNNQKYSKVLLNTINPILIIFIVAFISSFFYSSNIYDYIKDLLYLIKPILFIFLGYALVQKIKDKDFIFKIIIYSALVFSIIHLYKIMGFLLDNPFNVNKLRDATGLSNYIELLALVFLISNDKESIFSLKIKGLRIFKVIIIISFLLYFSRTMFVSMLLLILSIKGYLKITSRGVTYMSISLVLLLLIYGYLFSIDIPRNEQGIRGFLYKLKNAPSEIFSPKVDINNHANLWDHWRAYEAVKSIEQLCNTPYNIGLYFGKGLGGLVDLGFVAPLNSEGIQYISSLHNGYAFILYKAGFIGLISYLVFLIYLYLFSYIKTFYFKQTYINNFISGLAIYYAFSTLIITGIYNYGEIVAIILGSFMYLLTYYSKQQT